MTILTPLNDRVLVLPDKSPQKVGGLSQAPSQKEEAVTGVVVAFSYKIAGVLTVGQRVQWTKYSGRKTEHKGKEHLLLRLEEIDGVLEDEDV